MAKQKFPEAEARLFHRMFICMNCGSRLRSDAQRVKQKKTKCRRCKAKQLRALHKDKK